MTILRGKNNFFWKLTNYKFNMLWKFLTVLNRYYKSL